MTHDVLVGLLREEVPHGISCLVLREGEREGGREGGREEGGKEGGREGERGGGMSGAHKKLSCYLNSTHLVFVGPSLQ